ncbi:hypothetical protein CDD81_2592 [Ophiocordyceps australis]|uniref:Major facilitator superfamily (MFS) profile domain-containing protein n=1 Tax=Ophiocordyceps australis TaxID=1399860 RepID=A0A2C5XEL4_9HYPO|nr:hypothetical protein CDD81_2592 [Ophiocordyceps australis]
MQSHSHQTATEHSRLLPSRDAPHDAAAHGSDQESPPLLAPWRAVAVGLSLWLLIFLEATNMSGMAIIQGPVAHALDAPRRARWFTTSYLIATSSLAPLVGRLATIFSPRALAPLVAMLFALGSLVASQATNADVFILGRVLAGAAGGGVLSLSVVFVVALSKPHTRGVCFGMATAGITAGVSFGAVVYGGLLPIIGWRPLFWIQAPIAMVLGLAIYQSAPMAMTAPRSALTPHVSASVLKRLSQIDYLGALLLTLTIVLFLYGLAGDIQLMYIAISLVSLAAFISVEYLVAADPVIPLSVLSSRGVLLTCLGQLGLMSARWSLLFYAPVFMLAVRGAAPAAAGSVLIPTNLGFVVGGVLAGSLHIRRPGSFWLPTLVVFAAAAMSYLCLSLVASPSVALSALVVIVFFNGAATGAALNYSLAHLLHLSYPGTHYVTSSLHSTFRGLGSSFGTSIGGGIFFRLLRTNLGRGFQVLDGSQDLSQSRKDLIVRLLAVPDAVFHGGLNLDERQVAITGYSFAIKGVWKAAGVLVIVMVAVQALTGWTSPSAKSLSNGQEGAVQDSDETRGQGEE